ncbi:MAG TPA: PAS domain S-box protein, partial [Polyangiaceae bacterium]
SMGALYLLEPDATFRVRTAGAPDGAQLRTFFGHEDVLRWIVNGGTPVEIPSRDLPTDLSIEILTKSGATNVLVAPLIWRDQPLGALVLLARNRELDPENWRAFAQGVANQITQALALANAFETKERAEKDARGQASVLRVVLEATNEGVILADRDGKFLLWNAAAEKLSGSPAKDLPVSEWGSAFGVHRDERSATLLSEELPLVRAMRGENVEPIDIYVRPPGGEAPRWLRVSGKPIAPEEGEAAAVVVFQDVTEQRRRQTQLAASHPLISLGLVATSVAREITNPLSAVLSNLELAIRDLQELSRSQPLNKALSDELRDALAGAERVRHVATDLRLFSPTEETSNPVDVRRVLDAALRLTQSEVRQRGRVSERYVAVPPVLANEARLGHVFLNLLLNAAHNLPEGPSESNEIRVSTRLEPGGRVAISFSYATPAAGSTEDKDPGHPWTDTSSLISACRASIASFGGELTWTRWDEDEHVVRVSLPVAPSAGD